MNVVGIIPARGQSKGIPRKNLAPLGGKPLIAWTIEAAKASQRLSRFFVSTEDAEIANVAYEYGAPVIMRPPSLAQDDTPTIDVIRWHLEEQVDVSDAVMCLHVTAPLTRPTDIDGAIDLISMLDCDAVISYVACGDAHPDRMATIGSDGFMQSLAKTGQFKRRQDLDAVYLRSGNIYLWRSVILNHLESARVLPWIIPEERHCNIDTRTDLVKAGVLINDAI